MKKILHTADWHIGNFAGPEKDGQNIRALDIRASIESSVQKAFEEKPELFIIAGDLFHQNRVWADRGLEEVDFAIEELERIASNGKTQLVVLRGTPNHDGSPQFTALGRHFANHSNVHIVMNPCVLDIGTTSVACLPGFDRGVFRAKFPTLSKEEEDLVFTEELGKIVLALRAECKEENTTVLVTHYTVPGSNMESGQVQFFAQHEPIITPDVLATANFDLVTLGHIHRPQRVESCKNTFYSGAICQMNFNDEGQERGYWLHEFEQKTLTQSKFQTVPSREFFTISLDSEDVIEINSGTLDLFSKYDVRDKITRVRYNCDEENAKALNKAQIQNHLYQAGAFWVSEIVAGKVEISVNRNKMDDKNDPYTCLQEYMQEKAFPQAKIKTIKELASPIIDTVLAQSKQSLYSGIFEPVEISVKNYRNYAEETFSFKDITFCTINGVNGAGKSSLFMDAILDCIYEEPREGDLTGWIRADEKARSGSISFTFNLGEKQFRVVRTRAKSGKATLNLSENVSGEWVNRSADKFKDTQEEILNVVGMDSLTFKSCALIMQDQYGLFLQADKESRVAVMSNILGLGMYGDMQEKAKVQLSEANRAILQLTDKVNALNEGASSLETLQQELDSTNEAIATLKKQQETATAKREDALRTLSLTNKATENVIELNKHIQALTERLNGIEAKRSDTERRLATAEASVALEAEITTHVELGKALDTELERLRLTVENSTEKTEDYKQVQATIAVLEAELLKIGQDILTNTKKSEQLLTQANDPTLEIKYGEWLTKKAEQEKLSQTSALWQQTQNEYIELQNKYNQSKSEYDIDYHCKCEELKQLQKKMELLDNSGCVDAANANCSFLADAKEAQAKYPEKLEFCKAWKESRLRAVSVFEKAMNEKKAELESLDFDPERMRVITTEVNALESFAVAYQNKQALEEQAQAFADIAQRLTQEQITKQQNLEAQQEKQKSLVSVIADLVEQDKKLQELESKCVEMQRWYQLYENLPVQKERIATETERVAELSKEKEAVTEEKNNKEAEKAKELLGLVNLEMHQREYAEAKQECEVIQSHLDTLQTSLGAITERHNKVLAGMEEAKELHAEIAMLGEKSAGYEVLKVAFSPDGIPHNIIRSMLPLITSTANQILGQMTGGKMGVDFRTEKVLKSNSKKEVITLDVFIEEYGKPSLPYASKSGGEKVKSALAVILALAEMKSLSAGVQLGMLHIDEPPFLDGDGVQAYCDALETISLRYSDIKIMAITHDPSMKARFPQNLDVVKTQDGSRVIA